MNQGEITKTLDDKNKVHQSTDIQHNKNQVKRFLAAKGAAQQAPMCGGGGCAHPS